MNDAILSMWRLLGFAWNSGAGYNGSGTGCSLWSVSHAGNDRYLTTVDNGEGLHTTFTWQNARNNTHGLPTGIPATRPFYCTTASSSTQAAYPCDAADDQAWSRIVLTQRDDTVVQLSQAGQGGQQTSTPMDSQYVYNYSLNTNSAKECGDCVVGMYWGNQTDGDYLDYYNPTFMGFYAASVSRPDGSFEVHHYYAGQGWGVYDTSKVTACNTSNLPPIVTTCQSDPWWNIHNAAHGREVDAEYYDTNGTTELKATSSSYSATCPPSGVNTSGDGSTWDGNLVAELDQANPIAVCDIEQTQQVTTTADGSSNASTLTTTWTYDSYGRMTQEKQVSNGGTPGTVVKNTAYVYNDGVNPTIGSTTTPITGTYLIDLPAFTDVEDGSGNRVTCDYQLYDGQGYHTGQDGGITMGLETSDQRYTSCGTSGNGYTPSGPLSTNASYDGYGNKQADTDPDANAGVSGHTGCTIGSTSYTHCGAFDGVRHAVLLTTKNAKNQSVSTNYSQTASGGFGLWPISTTDENGNTTSYTYDALGRTLSTTLPGETSGETTTSTSYTTWCAATGAQSPCVEQDSTQRLDSSTTVTTRSFYDGFGRLVETRTPAPNNQDVVSYTFYDLLGRTSQSSMKYFVAAYTGAPGSAAFSLPDTTASVTTTAYDGLGRTLQVTDPLSEVTTSSYAIVCSPQSGDTGCYEQTLVTDANSHRTDTLNDALGRTGYARRYRGSGSYSLYSTTSYQYDVVGHTVKTTYPNGATATAAYDAAGRMTSSSDPDLGSYSYTYDANGNRLSSVDPRGSAGTVYSCYDGLNRKVGMQTGSSCSSPSGVLATWSYDSGTNGTGHLSKETFTSNGVSGGYTYTYDARGQKTGWTMTLGSSNYAFTMGYNDAGMPTTITYPDGDTLTAGYTAQGWPSSMTETLGSTTNTLVNAIAYSGIGGAAAEPTSATFANGTYGASYTYDGLARPTGESVSRISDGSTLYSLSRTFDNVGNVASVNTTLPAGTDNQVFCYDEQNRLIWAGSTGTPSCGTSLTAGTLTSAAYSQAFSYDTLNRLTSSQSGSYTYGDSHHLDAVTSTSGGYTATYDAAGSMTCRAPSSSQTCSGTATGQPMTYDPLRRLLTWQDKPSNPTTTESYAYDGEGQRVQMRSTTSSGTTITSYIGSYEEITTSGGTTTTTTYYGKNAVSVNGTISYLINDGLGSVSMSLATDGTVQGAQLFAPYGSVRYTTGSFPTTKAFTGQRSDGSGLSYFNARYYDPTVGQFTSADSTQGLNRYAYVAGNPETATDPTGHDSWWQDEPSGGSNNPAPTTPCNNTDHCHSHPSKPAPPPSSGDGDNGNRGKYQPCTIFIGCNNPDKNGCSAAEHYCYEWLTNRDNYLKTLETEYNHDFGIGESISFIIDLADFMADIDPIAQAFAFISLLADISSLLTYFSDLLGSAGKILQNIAIFLNGLAATAEKDLAAMQAGGIGATLAIAMWKGFDITIDVGLGPIGTVEEVIVGLLGSVILNNLDYYAHQFTQKALELQKEIVTA